MGRAGVACRVTMLDELEAPSSKSKLESALPFIFGITTVITATMVALLAQPVFGAVPPYVVYILPVMAAAAYGGLRPGLCTTGASILAIIFVFLHHDAREFSSQLFLLLFVLDGLGMLVNQGVIGIQLWTGKEPDAGVMRRALEDVFGG